MWITLGLGDLLGGKGNRRNSDSMNARTSKNRQKEKQNLRELPKAQGCCPKQGPLKEKQVQGLGEAETISHQPTGQGLSLSENEVRQLFSKEYSDLCLLTIVGLWRCAYQFRLPIHSSNIQPKKSAWKLVLGQQWAQKNWSRTLQIRAANNS